MPTEVLPGCEPFSATGSASGVLVLHGFTGNPQSLRPLAEVFAGAGYSVELPRLPGHGTTLEDMERTGWDDWAAAALAEYDALRARCDPVSVVGLSMGGGLACWIAEQPRDPAALVLINPLVRPLAAEISEGLAALLDSGVERIDSIGSDIHREGSREFSYPATPLACVASLADALGPIYDNLPAITAPVLLLQSREDHVVSADNGDAVCARVAGPVERVWLERSYHVATLDYDAGLIESAALAFVAGVSPS